MNLSRGIIQTTPLLLLALLILAFLMVLSPQSEKFTQNNFDQSVLSESDGDGNGSSGSNSSGSSDNGSSSSGSSGSEDEENGDQAETGDSDKDDEVRVDLRLPGEVRVKTRIEDDRERIDIYEGGRKLRIETRDGITIVKVENEEEEEIGEFEAEDGVEVEATTEGVKIKVRARGTKFVIKEGLTEAETGFPLSIDLATNELIVTTPAGVKRVTILPQEAVDNMLRAGHVDIILASEETPTPEAIPEESPEATAEASRAPEVTGQIVKMDLEDGQLVYVVEGLSRQKFFSLFDILIPRTVLASAEGAGVVGVRQSLISRILDALSL